MRRDLKCERDLSTIAGSEDGARGCEAYMAPRRLKDFHVTVRRKQGSQSYSHKELTSANKLNEQGSRSSP